MAANGASAEGAELFRLELDYALSALGLNGLAYPGRCPGLLHFAPLALRSKQFEYHNSKTTLQDSLNDVSASLFKQDLQASLFCRRSVAIE